MSKRNDAFTKLLDLLFEYCKANKCPTCWCEPRAPHEHYCSLAGVVQADARGRLWQWRWYWHTWHMVCAWCRNRGMGNPRHLISDHRNCRSCGEGQWRLTIADTIQPPDEIRGDD